MQRIMLIGLTLLLVGCIPVEIPYVLDEPPPKQIVLNHCKMDCLNYSFDESGDTFIEKMKLLGNETIQRFEDNNCQVHMGGGFTPTARLK